jgi:E3 ubiquitin-protein ligase BIG BROTHER-like protein
MNGSRQMELHYINTGYPYTMTESFMDFFEGLTYAHADFAIADAFQDQVGVSNIIIVYIFSQSCNS